jgi:hypothetical protein
MQPQMQELHQGHEQPLLTVVRSPVPASSERPTAANREPLPRRSAVASGTGEPVSRGRVHKETNGVPTRITAAVMETYWSASARSFKLASLAARCTESQERQALLRLSELEERRREIAQRILEELWGIRVGARSSVNTVQTVPWPVSRHFHDAN